MAILDLKMCPHLHHERGQLIEPCLFNQFSNNKIHFSYSNNTSKLPVVFMYSHYVPLINFSQKMLKTKQLGNISSHSTDNLKPKKPCGQSSIKAFYKYLPGKKVEYDYFYCC